MPLAQAAARPEEPRRFIFPLTVGSHNGSYVSCRHVKQVIGTASEVHLGVLPGPSSPVKVLRLQLTEERPSCNI